MNWSFSILCFKTLLFGLIFSLSACSICVNGKGIGCGQSYSDELEVRDQEWRERVDRSFITNLVKAGGIGNSSDSIILLQTKVEQRGAAVILQGMSDELHDLARAHKKSKIFENIFHVSRKLTKPVIQVSERGLTPFADCSHSVIYVPKEYIKLLLRESFRVAVNESNKPLIPEGPFYPGTIQPLLPTSEMNEFALQTAVSNTMAYRVISFSLAHESAHLWSNECDGSEDPSIQKPREARADLFASIISSELFSGRCMKSPLFVSDDTLAIISSRPKTSFQDIGELVADRMSAMDLNRFFISGGGDVDLFYQSVKGRVDLSNPSHPKPAERIETDEYARKMVVRQFYNDMQQQLNSNILMRAIIPREERDSIYEGLKMGVIGINYQEFVTADLIKCSIGTYQSTIRMSP
jgi:hypothetical protein